MGLNYRNILVVDDDSAMRALIARFIESGGYFVETAKDGFQALEMVENSSFDAVFLDLMMPNLSGLELLRRWNRTQLVKDLPILVITAKDDPKTVKQCLELGGRDFIVKPPTRATVVEKLEKVLKGVPPSFVYEFPKQQNPGGMVFDFTILRVTDFGITIKTRAHVNKGERYQLRHEFFDELGIGRFAPQVNTVEQGAIEGENIVHFKCSSMTEVQVKSLREWLKQQKLRGKASSTKSA